jgi:hypothetical protein
MVVHSCNPSTQEVEAGGSQIRGQLGLHSKFQTSLGYIVRPCLQNKQTTKQKEKRKKEKERRKEGKKEGGNKGRKEGRKQRRKKGS